MYNKQAVEVVISEAKDKLIKLYNPVAIYLFGSYAWGHPDEYSDLDFLIVVEKIADRYNDLVAGHRALALLEIPKDILLLTRQEFEQDAKDISTIPYKVMRKGKQIYAKA
jgi:predicted nucleotidyltransferase